MEIGRPVDRRQFMGGAVGLGALALLGTPALAAGRDGGRPPGRLPRREAFVIRGAYVLSMDPGVGDLPEGDVAVRDGRIADVGPRVRAGGRQIDGRGTIVLPGLIDTHWHMWTALHRSMAGSSPENGYFALNLRLGAVFQPEDIYAGVRLALAEAPRRASRRCTTGRTTSAGPSTPTRTSRLTPKAACAAASPTARPRARSDRRPSTWPTWSGCSGSGLPRAAWS